MRVSFQMTSMRPPGATAWAPNHCQPLTLGGSSLTRIAALHVLPSFRRHGIGRSLCERALSEARRRGYADLVLWVLEANRRARSFYESLGFRADGETRVFVELAGAAPRELRYRLAVSARGES